MAGLIKMSFEEWNWEPEFLPDEFKDPHGKADTGLYMQPLFMDKLKQLRQIIGMPIIIHKNGGFSTQGHAENSTHYLGCAADFHVQGCPFDETSKFIRQMGFNGVGAYEHWKPVPGWHVDMGPRRARWFRIKDGKYISLS